MTWSTQPVCNADWRSRNPGRNPSRIKHEYRTTERCCYCGELTVSGIFIRAEITKVPFPREEDSGE